MDKVMMWTIEGTQASPVQPISGINEKQLEEILVKNPKLLMPHLTLVGQQMQTEGRDKLDLLGVDRRDGRLVVFELKRETLSRKAIAQIIDYASYLEEMDLDTLVKRISDKSGAHGIDDFEKWYTEDLLPENLEPLDLESLRPLRMFLVGLGVDDKTERMVNFLSNRKVDISLLTTFYGITYEDKTLKDKTLLVQQVHQEGNGDENSEPAKYWATLDSHLEEYGLFNLFNVAKKMFEKNWPNHSKSIDTWGLNFSFPNKKGNIARLGVMKDGLVVVFFPAAIRLCIDDFKLPIKEIPFRTWRPGSDEEGEGDVRVREVREDLNTALKKYGGLQIQFRMKPKVWETHKKKLDKLTRALYDAQQRKMQ